mgnify:FL=1|jgi:hypothetical protein
MVWYLLDDSRIVNLGNGSPMEVFNKLLRPHHDVDFRHPQGAECRKIGESGKILLRSLLELRFL